MSNSKFASRMAQLRKEKGISQKDAAAELGISQALLSHYEKGVRECGLDFILSAAEYYGVTTDYLLGVQDSKYGFLQNYLDYDDEALYDGELDMRTVLRCGGFISEEFNVIDAKYGDKLKWIYALGQYQVLSAGMTSGKINNKWLGVENKFNDKLFQRFSLNVYDYLLNNHQTLLSAPPILEGRAAPAFIKKLVISCEQYIAEFATHIKYEQD